MTRLLALADDLTGALEVGACFADAGVAAEVATAWECGPEALVLDCETRHATVAEAFARTSEVARAALARGVVEIFQKTDSTLRGNIAAEFRALLETFSGAVLVYIPGYPRMGRQVRDGVLYVNGVELGSSAFANDPREPAAASSIPALLRAGCAIPVWQAHSPAELRQRLESVPAGCILVCDSDREDDLESLSDALRTAERRCIVAGTAAYAGYWIRAHALLACVKRRWPRAGRWLVVCGSVHPASRQQLAESGIPVFEMPAGEEAGAGLTRHSWCAIRSPAERLAQVDEPALRLAQIARRLIEQHTAEGIVVFGGDTAFALLEALGVRALEPQGELLPGIPISTFHYSGRVIPLVSKAGGFGDRATLGAIRRALEETECCLR